MRSTTSTTIIWADLVRLKKAAKAAKATYPNLTHAQRLDALARQEFGARHFHELLQRYEAHVASHVELAGAHHCRFCHFTFSDYDVGDRKLHRERHENFEEAQLALGYLPMPFKEREGMKRDFGYEQLYRGNAALRRMGALAIILSHFDRSLETAIVNGRWHKHPCFAEYLPCAIGNSTFLDGDLLLQLADEFGEVPGVIVAGGTDWPADVQCRAGRGSAEAAASMQLRETILAAYRSAQFAVASQTG